MMLEDKIVKIQTLLDNEEEATDDVIRLYLSLAKSKMLSRLYPFDTTPRPLPPIYDDLHCELSMRMYERRGGEGEIAHSENGINRTYGSVDDEDILSRLTPYAKVRL